MVDYYYMAISDVAVISWYQLAVICFCYFVSVSEVHVTFLACAWSMMVFTLCSTFFLLAGLGGSARDQEKDT